MRAFGSLPDCYRLPAPMVTYGHLVKGINMELVRRKIWNLVISAVHTGSTRSFFAWKKNRQRLATACHSMLLRRSALRCFDMFWRMAWVRQTERQWSILPVFCARFLLSCHEKRRQRPTVPGFGSSESSHVEHLVDFDKPNGGHLVTNESHWKKHFGGPFLAATRSRRRLHAKAAS